MPLTTAGDNACRIEYQQSKEINFTIEEMRKCQRQRIQISIDVILLHLIFSLSLSLCSLITHVKQTVGVMYTQRFPAEQPDNISIGHGMFVDIFKKYYVLLGKIGFVLFNTPLYQQIFFFRRNLFYFIGFLCVRTITLDLLLVFFRALDLSQRSLSAIHRID